MPCVWPHGRLGAGNQPLGSMLHPCKLLGAPQPCPQACWGLTCNQLSTKASYHKPKTSSFIHSQPYHSPHPPPAPQLLPHFSLSNHHLPHPHADNRDAANSSTGDHRPAMDAGKRAPAYQLLAQSGPGLSALPMVVHGARNGLCPSPVTNRVRDADHEG
jgi:hypothetical protein